MSDFVPLSRREAELGPEGPFEGVQPWMVYGLWAWADQRLRDSRGAINELMLDRLELKLRLHLPGGSSNQRLSSLEHIVKADEELFLDVMDYLVAQLKADSDWDKPIAAELESVLSSGGSVWGVSVSGDVHGLRRRLGSEVEDVLGQVLGPEDRASRYLATALEEAYGRDPNASHSYREAVRAVEAIAKPVVTPRDAVATLGKMISALREKPEKWSVVLSPSKGHPVLHIAEMMELLWTGQLDRHGTDDESAPLNVSIDEARAAVHISAALVQLFRSGAVQLV